MGGKKKTLHKRSKDQERIVKMGKRITKLHHTNTELTTKLTGAMSYIRFEVVELRKLRTALKAELDKEEEVGELGTYGVELVGEILETLDRVLDPIVLPEDEYLEDDEVAACDECDATIDLEGQISENEDGSLAMLCKACKPKPNLIASEEVN